MKTANADEQIITYWLCPAEPVRSELAAIIRDLARRFDAPVFEPHVTLCVTSAHGENPESVLTTVTARGEYRLAGCGLDCSDEFTKTLFIQFEPNPGVARLSDHLQRASVSPHDYRLNPHLSLLYKEMDQETKRGLVGTITLPVTTVTFDSVKAVLSPATINSRKDVEAWRVMAERSLTA